MSKFLYSKAVAIVLSILFSIYLIVHKFVYLYDIDVYIMILGPIILFSALKKNNEKKSRINKIKNQHHPNPT
jgi:hypothetical protein